MMPTFSPSKIGLIHFVQMFLFKDYAWNAQINFRPGLFLRGFSLNQLPSNFVFALKGPNLKLFRFICKAFWLMQQNCPVLVTRLLGQKFQYNAVHFYLLFCLCLMRCMNHFNFSTIEYFVRSDLRTGSF